MKKLETDRPRAEEDMEWVSQTTKRLRVEGKDWKNGKRKRSSRYFTAELLREASPTERVLRQNESDQKRIQLEEQAKAAQQTQKQLNEMIQLFQQQQHLFQHQQQQLFKQQQVQSQTMLTVILQQHQEQGQALLNLVDGMLAKE
ncbi:hypothetical protein QQF64_012880 [Cirrhinus molitorella]|uniref:Uncharacterized protein n=1 Tax=Cirrhinus molitorella TaxID=172907 RepID=A0ABR3LT03_9TELE